MGPGHGTKADSFVVCGLRASRGGSPRIRSASHAPFEQVMLQRIVDEFHIGLRGGIEKDNSLQAIDRNNRIGGRINNAIKMSACICQRRLGLLTLTDVFGENDDAPDLART